MLERMLKTAARTAAMAAAGAVMSVAAWAQTDVSFYFPVAVGGPITKLIDQYAADFNKDHPQIKVTPIN